MIAMEELRAIVAASGGVPGKALALIDSDVAVMEKKLIAIATSGDPENRLREALAREVGGTSNRARLELVIDIVPGLLSRIARERPIAEIAPVLAQWARVPRTVRDEIRGSYDGAIDRMGVVEGKSVSVRVDLGGRRIIKQKQENQTRHDARSQTSRNRCYN